MKYQIRMTSRGKFGVIGIDLYGNEYDSMHSFLTEVQAVKFIQKLVKEDLAYY